MRICSFFSSATELLYALGLGRAVVGRSERCDFPAGVLRKPVIVRSRIASERLSSRGIDDAVQAMRRRGEHQYEIDVALLRRLRPDLVITQELCNVCAAGHPEVTEALRQLPRRPETISISAGRFEELLPSIEALGNATGRARQAKALSERLRRQVEAIRQRVSQVKTQPRVWCAEWLEPLMAAGHWIPEMVALAGGRDGLAAGGENSKRVTWEEIRAYHPEVILVMPCSFSIARTLKEFSLLSARPGWRDVSAVKAGRVFAVETSLFHRPGPRLIQGLRLMAALFHPEYFSKPPKTQARSLARDAGP